MTGTDEVVYRDAILEALLEGGPADIPEALRKQRIEWGDHKIKILHRGGYEHFERDDGRLGEHAASERRPAIFRWTMRTKIAE